MVPLADGRIVLWEGGSLWVMDVPARPQTRSRTDFHAHHAIQITLALEGEFQLHLPSTSLSRATFVVAADRRHAFEPKGLIGLLFIDPESAEGRHLTRTLLADTDVATLDPGRAETIRAAMLNMWRRPATRDQDWRDLGQALVAGLADPAQAPAPDARVQASLAWAESHLDQRLGIAEVAARVGLSSDRMSHLFVEQTGLPFRTYLLWLRMRKAVDAYAQGATLTSAAHEAGFADSAHFSRTFRRMFGVAAAELRLA